MRYPVILPMCRMSVLPYFDVMCGTWLMHLPVMLAMQLVSPQIDTISLVSHCLPHNLINIIFQKYVRHFHCVQVY